MAPTLRSSTPTTPSSKTTSENKPSITTPRKAPTCSKCKRPRAGHPRSGCPHVDSPLKDSTAHSPASAVIPSSTTIEDEMGSMHLSSLTPDRGHEDTKAAIRNRRQSSLAAAAALAPTETLGSLDSESQELVERLLLQPGMFHDNAQAGSSKMAARLVRWQETLATPVKPKGKQVKMPGSLSTPSPDSSHGSVPVASDARTPKSTCASAVTENEDTATSLPRPTTISRTMSMEQRDIFLSSLRKSSGATVYEVPRDDIEKSRCEAINLGFHARAFLPKGSNAPHALLVLGDKAAVERLYAQMESEPKTASRFRAAAGAAVVGAVGAVAGLAYM